MRDKSLQLGSAISRLSLWKTLSIVQKAKPVKSMYVWLIIVPVVAKLFSKLKTEDIEGVETITLKIFEYDFILDLELPFNWGIFYLSALLFGLSHLIYLVRCHSIIKDHEDFASFHSKGKTYDHLYTYAQPVISKDRLDTFKDQYIIVKNDKALNQLRIEFWKLFDEANHSRRVERISCLVLYLAGFLMLSYVFYENAKYVYLIYF